MIVIDLIFHILSLSIILWFLLYLIRSIIRNLIQFFTGSFNYFWWLEKFRTSTSLTICDTVLIFFFFNNLIGPLKWVWTLLCNESISSLSRYVNDWFSLIKFWSARLLSLQLSSTGNLSCNWWSLSFLNFRQFFLIWFLICFFFLFRGFNIWKLFFLSWSLLFIFIN